MLRLTNVNANLKTPENTMGWGVRIKGDPDEQAVSLWLRLEPHRDEEARKDCDRY